MTESSPGQGAEHWKQKYLDQLDSLEQKEEEWARLESVLKRAIGRLSLAAEGHHKSLDRHIVDIRNAVKETINRHRLENILDDLSDLLTKVEDKQVSPDKKTVTALQQLIEGLTLPSHCDKPRKKLSKKLAKATDKDSEELVKELIELIKSAIVSEPDHEDKKPGLFGRLLGSSTESTKEIDYQATATLLSHVIELIPWPASLNEAAKNHVRQLDECDSSRTLEQTVTKLENLIKQWQSSLEFEPAPTQQSKEQSNIDVYRHCVLSFIDKLDNHASPSGKLAAFRTLVNEARQQAELDRLATELADLLSTAEQIDVQQQTEVPVIAQPPIQELLIRLLEQLVIPADLHDDVEQMKARLEAEADPADWQLLLKDVALLINSIRSRMQKEKHEFEDFLQQITGRLKEMDEFLQSESLSLQAAAKEGKAFDEKMHGHVQEIRSDVTQATDLNSLKSFVEIKLDVISQHIKDYRQNENTRLQDANKNLEEMQSRMVSLEQETSKLKKVIVEKNKLALFDALTGIPNRLAYEKKVVEEIARWKRFANPLSVAVWDVDFFKKVNDTYGHKAGDKVLKTIAQLLNERIRTTDFLARYGGEEFVMLLPGTKEEETLRLVNDLREKVASCGFHYHGDPVNITVSCGVSSFREGDTLEKVFERADQALYKAKRGGRNQCVVASCLS